MITDIHGFAVFHQEDEFLQLPCARLVNNRRGLIAIGVFAFIWNMISWTLAIACFKDGNRDWTMLFVAILVRL